MHKKKKNNIRFVTFLAIVSILGFFVIILDSFTGINIQPYVNSLIFIVIGVGLAMVGNILSTKAMLKHGLTNDEIAHITTGSIGIISVIVGILSLPLITFAKLNVPAFAGIRGFVALLAIILIIIETWLIKKR